MVKQQFKEGDVVELSIYDCCYIGDVPTKQYIVERVDGKLRIGPYDYKKCVEKYHPKLIKSYDQTPMEES